MILNNKKLYFYAVLSLISTICSINLYAMQKLVPAKKTVTESLDKAIEDFYGIIEILKEQEANSTNADPSGVRNQDFNDVYDFIKNKTPQDFKISDDPITAGKLCIVFYKDNKSIDQFTLSHESSVQLKALVHQQKEMIKNSHELSFLKLYELIKRTS